jgi:glycosyltransferase involved in cell wall biosynthesis
MTGAELAVVMPVYNEEANIAAVVDEWVAELRRLGISFELLAVNDGSRDGTGTALRALAEKYPWCVTAVEKANAGHGRACRTGYARAVESGAAWTLQIDSDGQCDPQFFAKFWEARAEADAIYGVRTSRDDGVSRVLISLAARVTTSTLCGIDLKDANVPYRLMRTSVLAEALPRIPEDFDMQNMALTLALRRRAELRWKYVPIHFRDRQGGTNSINVRRIAGMGWEMLRNLHRIR